ncbi:MAG TPA: tetratricopeptide repeat protein [Terracidiphilus sp.]
MVPDWVRSKAGNGCGINAAIGIGQAPGSLGLVTRILAAGGLAVALSVAGLRIVNRSAALAAETPAAITVDYPLKGSIFPPDMAAPTFQWRDPAEDAKRWEITVAFADGTPALHVSSKGEGLTIGEIDRRCLSANNKLPELTPEQAAAHTWKPNGVEWQSIRNHAVDHAATITVTGFAEGTAEKPLSRASMQLTISRDPVGAPIFYRDVPLMPSATEKGVIKPLDSNAVPLIAWRMRNLAEPSSHVVMTDLHSCANCHSFSRDGKTLGLDMDGPRNDKGLYAVVPVTQKMTVRTSDMISWASFSGETNPQLRIGFMSQVSPDGKYVMTTIKPPGTRNADFYYVANFTDYRFLQVFYPTRGILAWYNRAAKTLRPLPGADDPKYVQASAVWSPDGKYLVFARAEGKDANPPGLKLALFANDPAEMQIKYDMYRIPFNEGRGGTAEPIVGASQNGMSNSFAKISPDGKWMVFVQARNGQLMRPDGKLYIVPAAGGKARLMNCNTQLMNSWHSFSPNGRWLVFSSKSRSPYTQLFLTHIDEAGNDSPAILIENSTAANRAANIPEFVNMNPEGIEHIDTPAVDFYKQFDIAAALVNKGQYAAAIPEWQKALDMQPDDAGAHFNFGETLMRAGRIEDGVSQLQESIRLNPHFAEAHNNLGVALGHLGHNEESAKQLRLAIDENPDYAEAYLNLGSTLLVENRLQDAQKQFLKALELNPDLSAARISMGRALIAEGHFDEAAGAFRATIEKDPQNPGGYLALGQLEADRNDLDGAVAQFRKALAIDPGNVEAEGDLGHALVSSGSIDEAIPHLRKALELSPQNGEADIDLGIALAKKGQLDEAVALFQKALVLMPGSAEAHYYLGKALVLTGHAGDGLDQWKQALQSQPDSLEVLNDMAWVLATSRDDSLRNGGQALQLAQHAAQLTSEQEPAILGTLSAVYAEMGQFDKAIELGQRAADLAIQQNKTALAQNLTERLALFRSKTPIRQ